MTNSWKERPVMFRYASNTLFFLFILAAAQIGLGLQKSAEEKQEPFQWLDGNGETSGIQYPTRMLQPLSLDINNGPPVEIEKKESKVDAQTKRITSRVFETSVNGERVLTEVVVEEIKSLPGDRVHAVRTVSKRDVNGRLNPYQRDIQEITPTGTDSFKIEKTRLAAGLGGDLVEKERIRQIERRKGEQNVAIDRTRYVPDLNGKWSTAERRVSQNVVGEEKNSQNEQVYRYDVNDRRVLKEQIASTEWKDSSGETHRQSDSYTSNPEGDLQLNRRVTMAKTATGNGGEETSELIEESNPAAPTEGLRLVRKIVENAQRISANETEKQLEVLEPDVNGKMQSMYSQQSIEIK